MRPINAPIDQLVIVGFRFGGAGTVVVGFAEFNGFHASLEGGLFKGVVQFQLPIRKHGVDATLLPGRTARARGFIAADGNINRLSRCPRAFSIEPHGHGRIAKAEIPDVLMAGGDLPHVGRTYFFRPGHAPFPARTQPGGVLRDVFIAKEIGQHNRGYDHAKARRKFFQSPQQTTYAVGEGRSFVRCTRQNGCKVKFCGENDLLPQLFPRGQVQIRLTLRCVNRDIRTL